MIGTDAIQGVLSDLFSHASISKRFKKMPICIKLKDLLDRLKEENLEHGDLHFSNISYRMADDNSVAYLGFIDFEFSGPLRTEGADLGSVLTSAWSKGILPFMKKIVKLPEWFSSAIERGIDPNEELGRLGEGTGFQYRNPYKVLKMPLIRL